MFNKHSHIILVYSIGSTLSSPKLHVLHFDSYTQEMGRKKHARSMVCNPRVCCLHARGAPKQCRITLLKVQAHMGKN